MTIMWSIIGHTAALDVLERALASDRPPHADPTAKVSETTAAQRMISVY